MSIFYKSERIGKNGRLFVMYKFRTLKNGIDKTSSFAKDDQYTRFGWILRKFKLDEILQIVNVVKGDMWLVGPRPEEKRSTTFIPEDIRKVLLSVKPGMTSLSSIYFFNEEKLLQHAQSHEVYWTRIKPMKFVLDCFYVENKCLSFDIWIIWQTIKRLIQEIHL